MGVYSIKDLENLSGIKAHTLRIWESRYGIIQPKRTKTKIRYFDDDELRKVLNISFLNHNGYKISKIANMETQEIFEAVSRISNSNLEIPIQLDAMIMTMVNLDEAKFEKILATYTLQFGFEKTMLELLYPFLNRIGVLWQTGNINPAQEHFISNLIRKKLIVAIDGQTISPHKEGNIKKFVLFLPENELHEISLLFASYLLKQRNHKVIYLGQSLPDDHLKMINEIYQPDFFLTTITSYPSGKDLILYLNSLGQRFPEKKILVSGLQVHKISSSLTENVIYLESAHGLIHFLEEMDVISE